MPDSTYTERWFGKKFRDIPCFRTSFLTGISSGIVVYLGHFLYTSDVTKSTRYGFWSYIGITASTWCVCRYIWAARQIDEKAYKRALQAKIMMEGTELGRKIDENDV